MAKRLSMWFIANALLPIVTPVLFLCFADWLISGSFPLKSVLLGLIQNGLYVFSGLTLIFSLFEDCSSFKSAGVGLGFGIFFTLCLIATLTVFYFIQEKDSLYIASHGVQFMVIWIASVVFAISAKYKIMKNNKYLFV